MSRKQGWQRHWILCLLACVGGLAGIAFGSNKAPSQGSAEPNLQKGAIARWDASPALFVENFGEWGDKSVRLVHQGKGADVLLSDSGLTFQLRGEERPYVVKVSFPGSRKVVPEGLCPSRTRVNFYMGADQSQWRSRVPAYEKAVYRGLYPGIDLVVQGKRSHVKYEFHVAPGADAGAVRLAY